LSDSKILCLRRIRGEEEAEGSKKNAKRILPLGHAKTFMEKIDKRQSQGNSKMMIRRKKKDEV